MPEPRHLRWGASGRECDASLPGDDLIVSPDLSATRAITVRASAGQVWPWIAQLGQGRGGFYSYDFLENLVGCDIHSADRVVPGWQDIKIGDKVKLAPAVGLDVAALSRGVRSSSAAGHLGRDPDREPSAAQVPSGRFSHTTARLRPRPRPRGRLPGRGRPRLITTWQGRGR